MTSGRRRLTLTAVLLAGCLGDPASRCLEGVCADGTVCDEVHGGCVGPEQLSACRGLDDDTDCAFPGVAEGVCVDQVCFARGCGNGFVEADLATRSSSSATPTAAPRPGPGTAPTGPGSPSTRSRPRATITCSSTTPTGGRRCSSAAPTAAASGSPRPPRGDCDQNAPSCGDDVCNADLESCRTCPGDCGPCTSACGDFVCDGDEDNATCPADCDP